MPASSSSLSVPCTAGAAAARPKRCATSIRQCQSCREYGCALHVHDVCRGVDVARLRRSPQVELEVGPVARAASRRSAGTCRQARSCTAALKRSYARRRNVPRVPPSSPRPIALAARRAPRRPLRARQARPHRRGGQSCSTARSQRRRGARARHRLLRDAPDEQGQDARRPARARDRRRAAARHRARRAAGALRPCSAAARSAGTRSCTSARSSRASSRSSGPTRARSPGGAEALPADEHANRAREIAGVAVLLVVTDVGVDLVCAAERPAARARRLRAGAAAGPRGGRRGRCASSAAARATASTSTTRRSPRRPGSTSAPSASPRAATSARRRSRGCTTRASRTATCAACACRRRSRRAPSCASASRGRPARHRRVSPAHGPIGLALVRREVAPGATSSRPATAHTRGRRAAVPARSSRPSCRDRAPG